MSVTLGEGGIGLAAVPHSLVGVVRLLGQVGVLLGEPLDVGLQVCAVTAISSVSSVVATVHKVLLSVVTNSTCSTCTLMCIIFKDNI